MRKHRAQSITAVYTVTTDKRGEEFGNIALEMPASLRGRWRRWPERGMLMDLLHEMFRAVTYDRPLRKVTKR